jgi:hypothetical protein
MTTGWLEMSLLFAQETTSCAINSAATDAQTVFMERVTAVMTRSVLAGTPAPFEEYLQQRRQ